MSEHDELANDTVSSDDRWLSSTKGRREYLGFLVFFLRRRNTAHLDWESSHPCSKATSDETSGR